MQLSTIVIGDKDGTNAEADRCEVIGRVGCRSPRRGDCWEAEVRQVQDELPHHRGRRIRQRQGRRRLPLDLKTRSGEFIDVGRVSEQRAEHGVSF